MKTVFTGFIFYVCVFVICLFFCGGCETFMWYIPTIISACIIYLMSKKYNESEWRKFTGVELIQNYTGVDLLSEE